jgi:hypothetical protein
MSETKRTDHLDFRSSRIQIVRDWSGQERRCHFVGHCILCNRRTYAMEDGDNDPRGILGDHAVAPLFAGEHGKVGSPLPACFFCQNDSEQRYRALMDEAHILWARGGNRVSLAFLQGVV